MRLTPGVAVASTVLADLDTDGDGMLSDAEQRAYAERVLRDLSLTVDGNHLPLGLVSSTFPAVEEIKAGIGEILLTFRAEVPRGGSTRKLVFENHHRSGMAAYLVNCLFPEDPSDPHHRAKPRLQSGFLPGGLPTGGRRSLEPRSFRFKADHPEDDGPLP